MISKLLVVTGKAKQIFQTKSTGTKDVTLHADPIPVAARHLDYRLNSLGLRNQAGSNTGHTDNCCLAVRDVDRITTVFQ
jgi:hypothetical protein